MRLLLVVAFGLWSSGLLLIFPVSFAASAMVNVSFISSAPSGEVELHGSLFLPDVVPAPAVLLIAGSGENLLFAFLTTRPK